MRRTAAGLSTVALARRRSISLRSSGDQTHPGGRRQLPLLGHVADAAQILVDDLVALDPHEVPSGAACGGTPSHDGTASAHEAAEPRPALGRKAPAAAPHRRPGRRAPPANVGRMSTEDKPPAPRSLAEALRARDDASLAALLRSRPDLITPVPTDLTQLATRAGTRASVVRALERLDRFALQTAEALAVAPDPATVRRTARAAWPGTTADPAVVAALPARPRPLREQALVWGDDDRLRLVRTARELLAPSPQHPSPTGLGPTVREATAGHVAGPDPGDRHDRRAALDARLGLRRRRARRPVHATGRGWPRCSPTPPDDSREVLDRLVWGPPYGQVTADPARPSALAARPRPAAADRARHGRPAPRGRPASARRPRAPGARAGAAGRGDRGRRTVHRLWTRPRPGRRTPRSPPSRSC